MKALPEASRWFPLAAFGFVTAICACESERYKIVDAGGDGGRNGYEGGNKASTGGDGGIATGGSGGTGGVGGSHVVPDAGDALPDAGSDSALNPAPRRLIVFSSNYGIYDQAFAMRWNGTSDGATWQRNLNESGTIWSPTLAPLADLRDRMIVVEGLALHTVMGFDRNSRPPGSYPDTFSAMLTGDVMSTEMRARGATLDFMIGQANTPPGGIALSMWSSISPLSFDENGNALDRRIFALTRPTAGCNWSMLSAPSPSDGIAVHMDQMIPIVSEAFRCDRTRVITLNLPESSAEENGYAGSFGQDCISVTGSPFASQCFTRYQVIVTSQLARLAKALALVREGNGTLLDNTLIVWVSTEAFPEHDLYPWSAVLVSGANIGLRTGRYLHYGQNIPTPLYETTVMTGPPHNHLLVSIARAFGLPLDAIGPRSLSLRNNTTLDLTGPLDGL